MLPTLHWHSYVGTISSYIEKIMKFFIRNWCMRLSVTVWTRDKVFCISVCLLWTLKWQHKTQQAGKCHSQTLSITIIRICKLKINTNAFQFYIIHFLNKNKILKAKSLLYFDMLFALKFETKKSTIFLKEKYKGRFLRCTINAHLSL